MVWNTKNISFEEASSLFKLDAELGVLIRKTRPANRTKIGEVVGCLNVKKNYLMVKIKNKSFYVHRIIYLLANGHLPNEVDHIDGDTLNNRPSNLREATRHQNMSNRAISVNNKSGYKGVYWCNQPKRWRAKITVNGKNKHLGNFKTAEEAHLAYQKASLELHGEFRRL